MSRASYNYWKAQCAFRGLSPRGSTKILQERIRNATEKGMLPELKGLTASTSIEYLQLKANAKIKPWKSCQTMREKAEADPEQFLNEIFPQGGPEIKPIIIETNSSFELRSAAERFGLITSVTSVPKTSRKNPDPRNRVVIGRGAKETYAKALEIERQAASTKQKLLQVEEERIHTTHAKLISELRRGAEWDVVGSWSIKCPEIEEQYSGHDLFLDIYRDSSNGQTQMYGEFDFGIVRGVVRFEKPSPLEMNDSDEYDGDDSDCDANIGHDKAVATCNQKSVYQMPNFLLDPTDKPSPRCPTWTFRWCGEETGEGGLQLWPNNGLCSLTFAGTGGCKLIGLMYFDFIGTCSFSGRKVSNEQRECFGDIDEHWGFFSGWP